MLRRADVMVNTLRPNTAERLGLSPESLSARYPRLVVANVTGWGSSGPFRNYKGWEALVMAKTGVMHEKRGLAPRPGPAFMLGIMQQGLSFAEAVEFLLTGHIARRELLASSQDEFADALRNAHLPAGTPTYVVADITCPDGRTRTVKRTLVADYGSYMHVLGRADWADAFVR